MVLSVKKVAALILPLPDIIGPIFGLVLPFVYFVIAVKKVYNQSFLRILLKSSFIASIYGYLYAYFSIFFNNIFV